MKPLDKQQIAQDILNAHSCEYFNDAWYYTECIVLDMIIEGINEYNNRLSEIANYDIVWDCDESPSKHCEYNTETDPMHDSCIYCGKPEERK